MLLNLSSDVPFVYHDRAFVFFERKKLEIQLPEFFHKNQISELYVLNGPWNFSSTRVGVELVNILIFLEKLDKVFFLNKMEFFSQNNFQNIYLFSGNRNKIIHLLENENVKFVNQNQIKADLSEQTFESRNFLSENIIKYEEILQNYKKLKWHQIQDKELLKPHYAFDPIVNC